MAKADDWHKRATSARSLTEFREILENNSPLFKKASQNRKDMEVGVTRLRSALKATRKRLRVRQTVLADNIGTTQSGISQIENGSGDLGFITMSRYLGGLNIDPASWLPENAALLQKSQMPVVNVAPDQLDDTDG